MSRPNISWLIACIPLLCLILASCQSPLAGLAWLPGHWHMMKPDGSLLTETWRKESNRLMTGEGWKIHDGDSTFSESLRLIAEKQEVFYVATVPVQNKGEGVPFKLVSRQPGRFIFENRSHDFPQRIIYTRRPKIALYAQDSLYVRVESLDGKGLDFHFARLKEKR